MNRPAPASPSAFAALALALRAAGSREQEALLASFPAGLTGAQLGLLLLQLPEPAQRLRAARALAPLLDRASGPERALDGIPFAAERTRLLAALAAPRAEAPEGGPEGAPGAAGGWEGEGAQL